MSETTGKIDLFYAAHIAMPNQSLNQLSSFDIENFDFGFGAGHKDERISITGT